MVSQKYTIVKDFCISFYKINFISLKGYRVSSIVLENIINKTGLPTNQRYFKMCNVVF